MSTILEVRDLTHVYGAGTPFERTALDKVSLSIEKGEILGVIGHTGSGKSTLIQHFNGLLKPSSGEVLLAGQSIWDEKGKCARDVRFRVGLVFQYPEYQLFEETIAKDIAFGPKNMGLSEQETEERVKEAMAFVGLDASLAEKSPFALSGGQKRRVAIAGVIAMRPEVLVLDEPTAGLDPAGRNEILEEIKQYHRETGATVLLVSHSMEDTARMSDRMLVMNQAKVMLLDRPEAVFARAEEIIAAGLDVPEITKVFMELHRRGVPVSPSVFTIEQAAAEVKRVKGGGRPC
ncbi:energy-coupling factor transporter ATPase [Clostridiaceae bacterium]|nr:energy-coupling factor transporter ATPase [Clostridiaceae bacterium]